MIYTPAASGFSELYQWLVSRSATHFEKAGFEERPPVTLTSRIDPSVIFVGSVTNVFKSELLTGSITRAEFVVQPALRTQNLKHATTPAFIPARTSFFTAIGFMAPPTSAHAAAGACLSLYQDVLSEVRQTVVVQAYVDDHDLRRLLRGSPFPVEVIANPAAKAAFRHSYGHERLGGRNFNVGIRREDGSFETLGNLVVVEDQGDAVAVAFGLGSSTTLAAALDLTHPMCASAAGEVMPLTGSRDIVNADCVSSAVALLVEGLRPDSSSAGKVLRSFLRTASTVRRPGPGGLAHIRDGVEAVEQFLGQKHEAGRLGEAVTAYLETYERLLAEPTTPAQRARILADVL